MVEGAEENEPSQMGLIDIFEQYAEPPPLQDSAPSNPTGTEIVDQLCQ